MKKPINPPAFPTPTDSCVGSGMMLRDWFAGQALNAHLSDSVTFACAKDVVKGTSVSIQEAVASMAYQFADAMLAERAKGNP